MTHATDWVSRAEATMPGCCLASMHLPPGHRVVIERAHGAHMFDAQGRKFVDFAMGSGPLILGHAHRAVVEAVTEQAALGSTYFVMNSKAVEMAEHLVAAIPCAEAVRFQLSGSDATFAAMRLARAATGRSKVLVFEGGYHGGHDVGQLVAVAGTPPNYPTPRTTSAGVPEGSFRDVLVAPFNDLDTTRRIVAEHGATIAAILVEPLHRIFPPRDGFLQHLRDMADAIGAILIFDEVVTGFRLAWGGGQEVYGVLPDLACYGKVMGGGYPLAAVVGRRDLLEYANPDRKGQDPFCFVGGTLTGNPVACAAGLATLSELSNPECYPKLSALAERLRAGLASAARRHGNDIHIMGTGSILQVVFLEGEAPTSHRALARADGKRATRFSLGLIERGIFVNPGGKFYLSLAHSPEDINAAITAADDVLNKMHD